MVFAKKYRPHLRHQQNIGILLPSSVAGALANVVIGLLRKTSVNLNYTASQADREMAIEQCGIKTIITSRAFLEKLGLNPNDRQYLLVEDLAGKITEKDKQRAWFKARFLPVLEERNLTIRLRFCIPPAVLPGPRVLCFPIIISCPISKPCE